MEHRLKIKHCCLGPFYPPCNALVCSVPSPHASFPCPYTAFIPLVLPFLPLPSHFRPFTLCSLPLPLRCYTISSCYLPLPSPHAALPSLPPMLTSCQTPPPPYTSSRRGRAVKECANWTNESGFIFSAVGTAARTDHGRIAER